MEEVKKEEIKQEGEFKIKAKKPKKLTKKKTDEAIKVDLSKSKDTKVVIDTTEKVNPVVEEVVEETKPEEVTPEVVAEEPTVINEIPIEEAKEIHKEIEKEITSNEDLELPENVEKLVSFMKETGGTVEDYVRLGADYTNIDDSVLLQEYYKKSKPHLNLEEIEFMLEDKFSYDEDMDEERDVRKKKLAMKEEIAKAKSFLEETKSKYYDEIKLRPGVTQDQQRAMDFYNKHSKEQSNAMEKHELFKSTTKDFFNEKFKGFEFKVNEKRFRYGLSKPSDVADNQSNISNLVQKFMDDKGNIKDYEGYHKAIYMAENSDTVANHFYEQGKTDAIRDINAKSKNISNEPRATSGGDVYINGLKVKAINGVDSSKLKIKTKNNT